MKRILFFLVLWVGFASIVFTQSPCPTFEWATKNDGYTGTAESSDIAVDASGNSYITGKFFGGVNFGNVMLLSQQNQAGGIINSTDIFIAKLNPQGQYLWAVSAGGLGGDAGVSIATDASGNSYVTGNFSGSAYFGSTTLTALGGGVFVTKLDAGGNFLWAKQITGGESLDIAVDVSGNSYITGSFSGTATFGSSILTSAGSNDVFIAKLDANGNFQWAVNAGGTGADGGLGIAIDGQGNGYVTGSFSGTATFGSSILTSAGSNDIFIAKLNANGNFQWAVNAGGTGADRGLGIAVDGSGNSYVTGHYSGSASFGSIALSGGYDGFVAKLNTQGQYLWAVKSGREAWDVAIDASGNSYVTGGLYGAGTFGNTTIQAPGAFAVFIAKFNSLGQNLWAEISTTSVASPSGYSIGIDVFGNSYITGGLHGGGNFGAFPFPTEGSFVSKLNQTGQFAWVVYAGWRKHIESTAVQTDNSGNSYVTGHFSGEITLGSTTLTASGSSNIFIAKLNPQGQFLWTVKADGAGTGGGYDMAVDAFGNSYVIGYFSGSTTFGNITLSATNYDVFVAKLDASGNFLWAINAGGIGGQYGYGITVDDFGSSYVTGNYIGTATFGSSTLTSISPGNYDAFVAKLDANGNFLWAANAGGTSFDEGRDIAVDAQGNSYITGSFSGSAAFGSTTLVSSGASDAFVAKLDANGSFLWAQKAGGTSPVGGSDIGNGIAVDASGNSYVTGKCRAPANFGNITLNGGYGFVAKLNAQGQYLWAVSIGGVSCVGNDIAVDTSDNCYVTGTFGGAANFGGITLTSSGSGDAFVAKLDAGSNILWAKKAGGNREDQGVGISVSGPGNLYITGNTTSSGSVYGEHSLAGSGIFVTNIQQKFVQVGTMTSQSITCGTGIPLNGVASNYASLQWSPSTGLDSDNVLSPTASPVQATTYTLTATDACGYAASDSVLVNVTPFATLSVETFSNTITCGTSSQLYASVSGNVPNVSYSWSPTTGLSNSNIADPTANPTQTATYTVTATTPNGCSVSEPVTVNVIPFTLSASAASGSITCGTSTQLNAAVTENVPNLSFSWAPAEGLSNPNIPNPSATVEQNTTYTVTAVTPNGCSASEQVAVNIVPYILTATAAEPIIDCGTSTQLNAGVNGNVPNVSYSWSPPIGLSNSNIAAPVANPSQTTTYTVTAITPGGCSATADVTVTVNNPNPPVVNISSNTGEFKLCNNGLTLSASGFTGYLWSNGSTNPGITVTSPGTYSLTAIDAGGCTGTGSVTVTPLAEIIAPQGTVLCPNQASQNLQLNATGGMDSYLWNTGAQSQSIQVTQPGNYSVTVAKGSCTYTTSSVQVTVSNGLAQADFSHVAQNLTVDFTVISPSINFLSWQFGDGNTSFDHNPTHTYASPGTYDVTITVTDVCGNTAEKTKSITVPAAVGMDDAPQPDWDIHIFPNPAGGLVNIRSEKADIENITLLDINGRALQQRNLNGNETFIDVSDLSPGLYLLRIQTINGTAVKRFLKE